MVWNYRYNPTDEEIRRLEREVAQTSDSQAIESLVRAYQRAGISLDYLGQARELLKKASDAGDHLLATEALLIIQVIEDDARGYETPLSVRPMARRFWITESGRTVLPKKTSDALAEIVERVRARIPLIAPGIIRRREEEQERRRTAAASEIAQFELLASETPRATSWDDVWQLLSEVEGRSTQRCASRQNVMRVARVARESGKDSWVANTSVAKSYKYPVTYTAIEGRRTSAGDVRLRFSRSQTWGGGQSRSGSIVVPISLLDSPSLRRNPDYRRNTDEEYRRLERQYAADRDPETRKQLRRLDERLGKTYDPGFVCCELSMRKEPSFWGQTLLCEECGKNIKVCCGQKMRVYGMWPEVVISCDKCGYEKDFG